MNIDVFTAVLAALLVYRLLSPLVDRWAGLLWGSATHANTTYSGSATAGRIGTPKDRTAN